MYVWWLWPLALVRFIGWLLGRCGRPAGGREPINPYPVTPDDLRLRVGLLRRQINALEDDLLAGRVYGPDVGTRLETLASLGTQLECLKGQLRTAHRLQ